MFWSMTEWNSLYNSRRKDLNLNLIQQKGEQILGTLGSCLFLTSFCYICARSIYNTMLAPIQDLRWISFRNLFKIYFLQSSITNNFPVIQKTPEIGEVFKLHERKIPWATNTIQVVLNALDYNKNTFPWEEELSEALRDKQK